MSGISQTNMKYKITFKGRDIEPVFTEQDETFIDQWIDGQLPVRMEINNLAFYSADIKAITSVNDAPSETQEESHLNEEREYRDFRMKMLTLSLDGRANIMRIPNMVWQAHGNRNMPDDVKEKIKERQRAYFEEHPKCIFANPKVYRDLVPQNLDNPRKDELRLMKPYLSVGVMKLVENIIQTDLRYAERELGY